LFERILSASLAWCFGSVIKNTWVLVKTTLGLGFGLVLLANILLVSIFGEFWCRNMNMDPIFEVEEEEESSSPYFPPMVTPMAQES